MGGSTPTVSLTIKRPFFDDSPNLVGDVNMTKFCQIVYVRCLGGRIESKCRFPFTSHKLSDIVFSTLFLQSLI